MNGRLRRLLQTVLVVLVVAYTTLLAYQSLSRGPINNQPVISEKVTGKDYHYESNYISEDRVEDIPRDNKITSEIPSVTATLRPPTTTLDDVFISVKTTKHYHKSRLPIILTTWFQLAKEQFLDNAANSNTTIIVVEPLSQTVTHAVFPSKFVQINILIINGALGDASVKQVTCAVFREDLVYGGGSAPMYLTVVGNQELSTWFFTDTDDAEFQKKTHGHMINTNCSSSHNRKALCCKMSVEFDTFIDTNKKWFCHFDDDNYVNVPRLVHFLGDYSPREDWYLGKPSIQAPLEIISKDKTSQKVKFWFATGGAGFCLSRALALKMMPVASGGKFISTGEKIRLPDDVTMGYIIEHLLKKPLTVVDQFHSHLEPMKFIRRELLSDQISFSYSLNKDEWNVVKIEGFDVKYDPNRFLSLHCFLFPHFKFCPR